MTLKNTAVQQLFDEGYGFPDLLPYIEYEDGFFVLADGSWGVVWRLKPYETEGCQPEYLVSLSSHLENMLNRMPQERLACQLILNSTRCIQERYKNYDQLSKQKEGVIVLDKSFCQEEVIGPKQIDLYLTLRFFPQWKSLPFLKRAANFVIAG